MYTSPSHLTSASPSRFTPLPFSCGHTDLSPNTQADAYSPEHSPMLFPLPGRFSSPSPSQSSSRHITVASSERPSSSCFLVKVPPSFSISAPALFHSWELAQPRLFCLSVHMFLQTLPHENACSPRPGTTSVTITRELPNCLRQCREPTSRVIIIS